MDKRIQAVPVLKDNYSWLLYHAQRGGEGGVIVVDPGDAAPVEAALAGYKLQAVLLTHHHVDHVAGVVALCQRYDVSAYGPENIIPVPEYKLKGGERLMLNGYDIHVLATPGHAVGHVSYYVPEIPALLSGDVLFSGGCGRLLEGTAAMLFESLHRYDDFPDETLLCAGHEYTHDNMAFIASLGEVSSVFVQRQEEVERLRMQGQPTLPVRLGIERQINPFLRARNCEEFAHLRYLKDQFQV